MEDRTHTVVITGGNRGLGKAIAERFVASGHRTAVLTRDGSAPAGARGYTADVADMASLQRALDHVRDDLGAIDVAVANAGITRDRRLTRMDEAEFAEVIDVNLTGAFRLSRLVIDEMVKTSYGRIVFISSVGAVMPSFGQVNYASSKAGLLGMARAIAGEYSHAGVTANVVAPGFVETDMTAALTPERREAILARVPAARAGTSEEIAAAVAWLAGPESGYITGAWIPVDGGVSMGH